ncbi:hypothetical protein MNV49_006066 [Pseudohyphozyma bogoriensis]|nr:hypothetical protein MNV49_006066 [Pseudohyphozyma bogoriensis]
MLANSSLVALMATLSLIASSSALPTRNIKYDGIVAARRAEQASSTSPDAQPLAATNTTEPSSPVAPSPPTTIPTNSTSAPVVSASSTDPNSTTIEAIHPVTKQAHSITINGGGITGSTINVNFNSKDKRGKTWSKLMAKRKETGDHSILIDASSGGAGSQGGGIKNSTINLTVISKRQSNETTTTTTTTSHAEFLVPANTTLPAAAASTAAAAAASPRNKSTGDHSILIDASSASSDGTSAGGIKNSTINLTVISSKDRSRKRALASTFRKRALAAEFKRRVTERQEFAKRDAEKREVKAGERKRALADQFRERVVERQEMRRNARPFTNGTRVSVFEGTEEEANQTDDLPTSTTTSAAGTFATGGIKVVPVSNTTSAELPPITLTVTLVPSGVSKAYIDQALLLNATSITNATLPSATSTANATAVTTVLSSTSAPAPTASATSTSTPVGRMRRERRAIPVRAHGNEKRAAERKAIGNTRRNKILLDLVMI